MAKQETFWPSEEPGKIPLEEISRIRVFDFRVQHALLPFSLLDPYPDPAGKPCYLPDRVFPVYMGLEYFAGRTSGELEVYISTLVARLKPRDFRTVRKSLADLIAAGYLAARRQGRHMAFALVWRREYLQEGGSRLHGVQSRGGSRLHPMQSQLHGVQYPLHGVQSQSGTQHLYSLNQTFSSRGFKPGASREFPDGEKCPTCGKTWGQHGMKDAFLHQLPLHQKHRAESFQPTEPNAQPQKEKTHAG